MGASLKQAKLSFMVNQDKNIDVEPDMVFWHGEQVTRLDIDKVLRGDKHVGKTRLRKFQDLG